MTTFKTIGEALLSPLCFGTMQFGGAADEGASPIVGARTVEQLRPTLAAAQTSLSDEDYERITALSHAPAPATERLEET